MQTYISRTVLMLKFVPVTMDRVKYDTTRRATERFFTEHPLVRKGWHLRIQRTISRTSGKANHCIVD